MSYFYNNRISIIISSDTEYKYNKYKNKMISTLRSEEQKFSMINLN